MKVSRLALMTAFEKVVLTTAIIATGASFTTTGAIAQATIKVPQDLCDMQPVSEDFVAKVAARPDYRDILIYLNANCPSQALIFADAATGSIPEAVPGIVLLGREGWQVNKAGNPPPAPSPSPSGSPSPSPSPSGSPSPSPSPSGSPSPSPSPSGSPSPSPSPSGSPSPSPSPSPSGNPNNGWGNGSQPAPGGSCNSNQAENTNCKNGPGGNGNGSGRG